MKKDLSIKGKPVLVYGKRPFSLLKWLISSATETIIKHYNAAPVYYNNYRLMPN
jgi:hypothetical protein